MRRDLGYSAGVISTLLFLSDLLLDGQESGEAMKMLDECDRLAEALEMPLVGFDTRLLRARHDHTGIEGLETQFETLRDGLPPLERMAAAFALWRVTNADAHLAEAHETLGLLVDAAPESTRSAMQESVRLHREIVAAWEDHRA